MELSSEARELFSQEMAAKFLATVDPEGRPNVALIVTLQPPPDGRGDRLIFGEFLMWRSKEYLQKNPRVGMACIDTKLRMVALTGDFRGFERTGAYKEAMDASPLMRYNAYSGVRSAGVIDVREVGETRKASFLSIPVDLALLGMRGKGGLREGVEMPRPVKEKFTKLTSIKALAVMGGDGYPRVIPVLPVAEKGKGLLLFRASAYNRELAEVSTPCPAAMALVTMDAKSYKVKGELQSAGRGFFALRVDEVYNAMPPRVGERIVPPEE
ncbi:MAG: pyridoxamine 5'-phosphate oxidase family protein [Actinobacteria bacterium]|nr:pyridoxamine 5'-phosphate oxidase family protein [Actinomycetota bacterium]